MKQLLSSIGTLLVAFVLIATTFGALPSTIQAQSSGEYVADVEYTNSVRLLYANAFTRYNDAEQFRPASSLTRQEAAKMFLQLFMLSNGEGTDKNTVDTPTSISSSCMFDDVATADSTLVPSIELACEYGIMVGSSGSFRPFDQLTKAEAVTVIMRIQQGMMVESVQPRWRNYREMAYKAGVTAVADVYAGENSVTRYEAALLMGRVLASVPGVKIPDTGSPSTPSFPSVSQTELQQKILAEIESLLQAFEGS